jgi:hypothetical protein
MERVLLDMDILHDVCNPFSPQEKPFVERIFRTFLHDTVETLTGYAGHNVTERKALEARRSFAQRMMTQDAKVELRLSPEELQSICDQWANNTYQHQKHSKLGCTPYEKVLSYAGGVRRVQDAEALRLLFLPCPGDGARKVQKDGVRLFNDLYISPELALHVKRHVQVRVDDADLGLIYIYNLDGTEYICAARGVKHAGLSQNDLQSIAQAARHLQNSHMRGGKASMRAAAEAINPDQTAYERMKSDDARARRIEAEQPLRAELMDIHSTPALESAADANASRSASWTPAPMTQQQIAAKEKAVILAKDAPKPKPIDAGEQRYARACNLRGRTNAGQRLNPDDERWLLGYERSNEFHRQKTLHEMRGAMLRIA